MAHRYSAKKWLVILHRKFVCFALNCPPVMERQINSGGLFQASGPLIGSVPFPNCRKKLKADKISWALLTNFRCCFTLNLTRQHWRQAVQQTSSYDGPISFNEMCDGLDRREIIRNHVQHGELFDFITTVAIFMVHTKMMTAAPPGMTQYR